MRAVESPLSLKYRALKSAPVASLDALEAGMVVALRLPKGVEASGLQVVGRRGALQAGDRGLAGMSSNVIAMMVNASSRMDENTVRMWPPPLARDDVVAADQAIQDMAPLAMFGSRRARAELRHIMLGKYSCDVAAMGPWPGVIRNEERVILEDGRHEVSVGPSDDSDGWAWAMCVGDLPVDLNSG